MKIGRGVSELWRVENRPLPLTWAMAYTTACTTVQAVIHITVYLFCRIWILDTSKYTCSVQIHSTISFLCHCCLVSFDTSDTLTEHMNQNGAHLRPPLDVDSQATVLPLIPFTSTEHTSLENASFNDLLQMVLTDDTVQVVADSDLSGSSEIPLFSLALHPHNNLMSKIWRSDSHCTKSATSQPPMVTYAAQEYQLLRNTNTEQ